MDSTYRQLIADTRRLLEEEWPAEKVLLTQHTFLETPSLRKAVVEKPSLPTYPPQPQSSRIWEKVPLPEKGVTSPVVKTEKRPLSPPSQTPFHKVVEALFLEHAPHIRIVEKPTCDQRARRLAEVWKEEQEIAEATLLHFGGRPDQQLFLQNLCRAIDTALCPAHLLDGMRFEREEKWEFLLEHPRLRWVISSPQMMDLPGIRAHYRELPATGELRIGKAPLFLLSPIDAYLNDPSLKRALWQKLSSLL